MGIFDLFKRDKKKVHTIGVCDLMYAYMKRGKPLGDMSITWNMKNNYPDFNATGTHNTCLECGLIRKATAEEKLSFVTMNKLNEICNKLGIKAKKTKPATIAAIMESDRMADVDELLSEDMIELTDKGKELLSLHDYIPYIVTNGRGCYFDYGAMWSFREQNRSAPLSDVLMAGIDRETISILLFDERCEEIDEDSFGMTQEKYEAKLKRECDKDAKQEEKDLIKKVEQDIKSGKIV